MHKGGSALCMPSFFVIGPPRTGTSWLHEVLNQHTVLPTVSKETRFFDSHFRRGFRWYSSHFHQHRAGQPIGEIAPTYFASSDARERISRLPSVARVICIFRNPVERILSLYRLKSAYGFIPWTFEEALLNDPELLESSRYSTHLTAWREALGKERVMATIFDDLQHQPQAFVDALAGFIGIPPFELSQSQITRVHSSDTMTKPRNYFRTHGAMMFADWLKARRLNAIVTAFKRSPLVKLFLGGGRSFDEPSHNVWLSLYDYFRPEVEALETMLGRDLSAWKYLDNVQVTAPQSTELSEPPSDVMFNARKISRSAY